MGARPERRKRDGEERQHAAEGGLESGPGAVLAEHSLELHAGPRIRRHDDRERVRLEEKVMEDVVVVVVEEEEVVVVEEEVVAVCACASRSCCSSCAAATSSSRCSASASAKAGCACHVRKV